MLTSVKIDNRIDAHLGLPEGIGKRPAIIHMHERYGIVQHTLELGEKYVQAGYVTIVPDYFSRFTGDRAKLAEGNDRCELSDDEVLLDTDAVVDYLGTLPQVDIAKIAMSGVCQTGRQPILLAAKRDYFAAAVVLYGAVYEADWKTHTLRPESIEDLLKEMTCPLTAVFGERLKFPIDFVGRGDMSRGGLLLRCVRSGEELPYVPVHGAVRHGPRPPKLAPIKGILKYK